MGRGTPQASEKTPPTAYGAGVWKQSPDGVWESKGVNKKYAIQTKNGEWITAHLLNSRSLPDRREIVSMLRQTASLQERYPLPIRPELVIGDMTAKRLASNPHTSGFVFNGTQMQKNYTVFDTGLNVFQDEVPVGPHVIYVNSSPEQLSIGRAKAARDLTAAYKQPDVDAGEYIVTHEFGHLRYFQKVEDFRPAIDKLNGVMRMAPRTGYARSQAVEAHAEAFADWVLSRGQPLDPWTNSMAAEMRWAKP